AECVSRVAPSGRRLPLVSTRFPYTTLFRSRFSPSSWSYLWRQGLSNLFRPNNQTAILIVAIGLGTAFIATLFAVQSMLITRVTLSSSENQPNMVLFDIQSSQKAEVAALVAARGLPVLDEVPIVTVQLEAIN